MKKNESQSNFHFEPEFIILSKSRRKNDGIRSREGTM
uniref:Uncharacterized protein n=1 Tax=Physcomitrium patens TaxID=3218 RepID=A0A2K1KLS7_PHYPA|nr:hypothetical protein PHYPA_005633 [Physcomitrium patens]